jgi:putative dimethyl sulfoxide reductase chaperone
MSQIELRGALADDLEGLARLHDREIDRALVDALVEVGFPDNFALLPADDVRTAMRAAALELHAAGDQWRDELAADFAGIYLNGACGASPYESVWLTDEHLTCQLPMFEMRALYDAAGLTVDDWRKRYDDHFVLQFQYLAHCLRDPQVPLERIGALLDEHVGHWFGDFAQAVANRAGTDFYRVLALLTADWLERLRALVEEVTGESRTPRDAMAERIRKKLALATGELAPVKFVPGGGANEPGW